MTHTPLREYEATYADGYQFVLMARDVTHAVLSAKEMHNTRLIRVLPKGEW